MGYNRKLRPYLWIVLSLTALSLLAACHKTDRNRATIQGEVKLDGRPVEHGTIMFAPAVGVKGMTAGAEIVGGHYQLETKTGPAIGVNRVEIRSPRKTGKMIPKPFPYNKEMMEEAVEGVAPRFHSETTLQFDVKPGENKADFAVSAK